MSSSLAFWRLGCCCWAGSFGSKQRRFGITTSDSAFGCEIFERFDYHMLTVGQITDNPLNNLDENTLSKSSVSHWLKMMDRFDGIGGLITYEARINLIASY